MEFQDFNFDDKQKVISLLESSDEDVRSSAIVGMVNGISDLSWVQEKLLHLVNDPSFWVAKNAITGLADLARIHRDIDVKRVKEIFKHLDREDLQGVIKSTLDDFEIFLK